MELSVGQIAKLLQAEVSGEPDTRIHTLAKIEEAESGSITFLANPKYLPYIYTTQASAVIVSKDFVPNKPLKASLLKVDNPYASFTTLLSHIHQAGYEQKIGIEQPSFVHETAILGEDIYIGAFSYIGKNVKLGKGVKIFPGVYVGDGAQIGDGCILYPHVSIYHACLLGPDCIIHAGSVVGSDGFGFAPQADGSFQKIPQTGIVRLEAGVEIGANSCIDRATMGETLIKSGAKLDNLVQLAHNVEIGENTVIAAQAGISGSTQLGRNCMVGGQAGFTGHLKIADRSMIDAQSGVNRNIKEEGNAFRGSPIQPHRQQLKSEVLFRRLEEMHKKIQQLEKALAQDN